MPKIWILVVAFIFVCVTKASADQSEVTCNKVRGMIAGPMVPTQEVAKEIYLAVAQGRGDKVDPANLIRVDDDGDHWSVFQFPADLSSGQIVRGGGTLEMTIAKCDGSILAHYSR
jgi:hypothetical protein